MPGKNWQTVKDIFHDALRLDGEARDKFLDEACRGDIDLRIEVESLLISLNDAKSFLEQPLIPDAQKTNGERLKAGQEISHYKIISWIATGGMGEVYLAEDNKLRRQVALKVLPEQMLGSRERLERFQLEADVVSALNHPNILTIFEFDEEDGIHLFASEFVKGETLRDRLNRGPLTLRDTLEFAIQIASALRAAHEAGVIHRDIKPENVMIRDDGYVKVLDFGLAKLTEPNADGEGETRQQVFSRPGIIMGTASYMSPEQSRARPIDSRSDIFSFGVVLYEMVTGRKPFDGDTTADVIAAIIQKNPRPVSSIRGGVPDELDKIITKTIEKDRDERYQTAADLLVDLKRARRSVESGEPSGERTAMQPAVERPTEILTAVPTAITEQSKPQQKPRHIGIAVAVVIVLVTALGLGYWYFSGGSNAPIESIAVMPFLNESGNADVEYLSDGMTETLIGSLSQLPNLNVKARSSVFRYKGKETDAQTIGKELNVQAILNGRVVQRGNDLTLYVELVDTKTENVLWKADYNKPMANLVLLQSEVARDVSNRLRMKLSGADESRVTKRYTDNPEAYELYLKGRFFAGGKITEEGIKKSIEYYQQAIEKDPNYALAYVGLAQSNMRLGHVWGFLPPRETFPKAKTALTKALEIDEALAEAHGALGDYNLSYAWDWPEAEREFKRAIELNPNDAAAHSSYGTFFQARGRFDEAIAERKLSREIDPLSPTATANVGYPYYYARQYDQAIEHYRKALDLDPNYSWSYLWIGQAYLGKRMYDEALAEINKAITLSEGNTRTLATLGYAYAVAGKRGEAEKVISELQQQAERRYVSPYFIAVIYSGLGDKDKAFASLEKAYQERHPYMTLIKVEPVFDNLRPDTRFQDLLRRVGLPE